jgi:hypothetical protein
VFLKHVFNKASSGDDDVLWIGPLTIRCCSPRINATDLQDVLQQPIQTRDFREYEIRLLTPIVSTQSRLSEIARGAADNRESGSQIVSERRQQDASQCIVRVVRCLPW